jgi:hypothetical protein
MFRMTTTLPHRPHDPLIGSTDPTRGPAPFHPLVAYDLSDDGRTIVGYGVNADDDPALAGAFAFLAAPLSLRRAARRCQ